MEAYIHEYALPITLPGKPGAVFEALSDANALKAWFAEHAEVEAKEGGAYRFWGRYSLEPKDKAGAAQVITSFKPPESLAFSWRVLGCDSEVTWLLKPAEDGGTSIAIRHAFEKLPKGTRVKELIDDLWRLHTGNLLFYLLGDREIYRPDFDDPDPVVRHVIKIRAPRAKVFAALTRPEYIKQWFPAPAPVVEPRVGGKYGFGFTFEKDGKTVEAPAMKILEFEKDRKLVTTWPDWRGDPAVPDQKIEWILEDDGEGTKLTLLHSGFTRAVDVSDYPFGWVQFIEKIRDVSEAIRD